mgnify:CR=1 FL=1
MNADNSRNLGLRSGIGLVVANMIGAGVFLSAGFMAQDMGPGPLMFAWVFGACLALCGARAYAEIAGMIGRSGGEYTYLKELLHPSMGYLAGWGSLLLGFAAPIALDAYAAGAFFNTLAPGPDPRLLGTALVVLLTAAHALHLGFSKWAQNLLVVIKVVFVLGFVALGLSLGATEFPTWEAPNATPGVFPWEAFFANQFWIAFAFSGWNAAIYAAGRFRRPKRDVPWAMLIGCGGVAVVYLAVNWVFVANLTPEQGAAVFDHESTRVTLGHLVVQDLVGPVGATVMSVFAIIAFTSAMSAMTLVGPWVYAAMAEDGYLPKFLAPKTNGKPPLGSLILQGGLALTLLWTHSVLQVVESAGGILLVFSGLTVATLFKVRFFRPDLPKPALISLVAAGVYIIAVSGILYVGFKDSLSLLLAILGVCAAALGMWALTRGRQPVSVPTAGK